MLTTVKACKLPLGADGGKGPQRVKQGQSAHAIFL